MRNTLKKLAATSAVLVVTGSALIAGEPFNPVTELTTAQTSINSIWEWAAGIMVGVAILGVGLRFFKKSSR